MSEEGKELVAVMGVGTFVLLLILGIVGLGMWGWPQYKVWQQGLEGEAQLAKATQNRKIRVQEAEAKKDAAVLEADAEVSRASGLAKANQILGASLAGEGGDRYLRYLWITALKEGKDDVIYVPTEAGLPILEAGRLEQFQRRRANQAEAQPK